jgi:uncharacterized Zn-binding protein involved in type VI secretion
MGYGVCRIGDTTNGICYHSSHDDPIAKTGSITGGSTNVFANTKGIARNGDIITASCGHTGIITGTSGNVYVNGKQIAKIGSTFTGDYRGTLSVGSSDVFAG